MIIHLLIFAYFTYKDFIAGGVASAFFWGIVGDVFGRRNALSLTLLLDAAITLAQSFVPDYRLLLAARTINGFVIGEKEQRPEYSLLRNAFCSAIFLAYVLMFLVMI